MTIEEALRKAVNMLKNINIEEPIKKSKILLAYTIKKHQNYLLINKNEELLNEDCEKFLKIVQEFINGKPIQYITNNQEFMGMNFFVNENVLIPRPDTEVLVEEVLDIIDKRSNLAILDMCTGSGAIAISIAKYTDNKIYAVDISESALEVAKKNAVKNGVDKKIEFINSNMFENINGKFDIIVSNPPYIETNIIPTLDKQVQNEPIIALDGGKDGLEFYRNISINAKKYLNDNGIIVMEIGYNQKEAVTNIFKNQYNKVYCKKDYAGNDRVITVIVNGINK